MANFTLVRGAWHGGWCWKRLAPLLRAAGHEALAWQVGIWVRISQIYLRRVEDEVISEAQKIGG